VYSLNIIIDVYIYCKRNATKHIELLAIEHVSKDGIGNTYIITYRWNLKTCFFHKHIIGHVAQSKIVSKDKRL
jgi:hypothetical protein